MTNKKNMKNTKRVLIHGFNGYAEDGEKFVEVDGKKFESVDGKEPKKDESGNPIPFKGKEDDTTKIDASSADLETLAKVNPAIAKILADQKELNDKIEKDRLAREKAEQEEAEKKGEWQKLAEERQKKLDEVLADNARKGEQLDKYIGSTKKILADTLKTIPEEKRKLIPANYSVREQLEYISENASLLGAKVIAGGGNVPKNDDTPNLTEIQTLTNEVSELMKKGSARTATESQLLFEKSSKLEKLKINLNSPKLFY